jgi:CDP-diacylglycerol--serine O-phosphatidyltransferase
MGQVSMKKKPLPLNYTRETWREHRRRRFRRHGKRAYIRSAYSLPSLATLGNAICGFGAMYVVVLEPANAGADWWTQWFAHHRFLASAYLIFLAMVFDALDGRLARFTRHTTDFGGQLDSLADVISFGVAPAFLALQLFRHEVAHLFLPVALSRLIWAFGAIYLSCAALRLARFNVSNEHGEQHHFSFLGLPSPGAAGTVAGMVLMQQELALHDRFEFMDKLATACVWLLPIIVLLTGLLMVSAIRYPHLVNKYLRGKRSMARLLVTLSFLLLIVVAHRYVLALGTLAYSLSGPLSVAYLKWWPRRTSAIPPPTGLPEAQPP